MPTRAMPVLAWGVLLLALLPISTAFAGDQQTTERWYEQVVNGQKSGYYQVVWAPSTWESRKTVHDTTRIFNRTVRNMVGMMDQFTTSTQLDLERGEDGTLWWQRTQVEEAGRVTAEELKWVGDGYAHVAGIVGEKQIEKHIQLDAPVTVDAESYLGFMLREGKLAVGQTHELRQLNVRAGRAETNHLKVVAKEKVKDESGDLVECFQIMETNPRARTEMRMWLDADGAFVKLTTDSGLKLQRVTRDAARAMPSKPAEMRITTPSNPPIERVFSADRHLVDLHVQGDPDRKQPEFPDSPWSRMLSVKGSDAKGYVFKLELKAYDSEEKTATIPVTDPAFADDLKPTVLMQSDHDRLRAVVESVVGDETDARKAAYLLVRHVFSTLSKRSPDVGQASALEILDSSCGDCSEHALLFVALCRAAGIPAQRCSGYVNIGGFWGAHAWAEIFTGQWIAADPTTGEIGSSARYLFFGYSDRADSFPGAVSGRLRGRMRFVSTQIDEGEQSFDLTDPAKLRIYDPDHGRYVHALAGIEARGVPSEWKVELSGAGQAVIRGDGFGVSVSARADQGYNYETYLKRMRAVRTTFGGAPALLVTNRGSRVYHVFSRRRHVVVQVGGADATTLAMIERCLTPTFVARPTKWDPDASTPEDGQDD